LIRMKIELDEYYDAGPMARLLGKRNPKARMLDQSLLMGNGAFTISTMAEGAGLDTGTVFAYIRHLKSVGWVRSVGFVGKKRSYSFDMEKMRSFVRWASEFQGLRRAE